LLAKIEEDYREIGVMKAIGLRVSDIRKIYLAKYAALSGCGAVLGFALSLAFRSALLENIRLSMGESKYGSLALLFGGLGVALIFLAVVGYVSHVLKRFKRISASQAIRFGLASDKSGGPQSLRLSKNRLFPVNVFLGVKDVLTRKKLYVTMLVVLSLAMFIMIVPQNLYHTVAAKSFVNYMGIGDYDFRIDVQQTDDILAKIRAITETVKSDKDFSKFAVFITRGYSMQMKNGSTGNIKVELGEHTIFPVAYAKGNAPRAANEIALSQVNADELEKTVGDEIILVVNGDGKPLTVCGVYSDFTNGGKTAKAAFLDDSPDITWAMICGELGDNSLVDGKVTEYASRYSFAKVSSVNEHIQQVFGGTLSAINTAAQIAIIAAIAVTLLVVILFMKMLAAKDRYEIAVMKSVGFTNGDVSRQYITRSFSVLIIGVLLGVILSGTLGEMLAGLAISAFNGGTAFNFTPNPAAYLFCVLTMAISAVIATLIGTSGTGKINLAQHIKE
jgi:putative ABC transport system permease protein